VAAAVVLVQMLGWVVVVVVVQVDSVLHRAFRYRLELDIQSQSAVVALLEALTRMGLKVLILFFPQ
jgi:hypothetical protein